MFPSTCAISASLSESASGGDRHKTPARTSLSVGIPSKAIGLPGIMLATLGVSPAGRLPPFTSLLLKLQTYAWIKFPLHFYGTFDWLPLGSICWLNLFLSQLLTPIIRTLPPCRQHCSTQSIIKTHQCPLQGQITHSFVTTSVIT